MARAKRRRRQFKFTLPEDVLAHLEGCYRSEGWEKSLQTLAGIIAFEALDPLERRKMIQCATQVAQGEVDWNTVADQVYLAGRQPMDDETVRRTLEALIKHHHKRRARRRQA